MLSPFSASALMSVVRRDITIEAPPRRSTKPKFKIMPENGSPRSAATGYSAAVDPDGKQREMNVTLESHPDGTTSLCALAQGHDLGRDERQVDPRLLRRRDHLVKSQQLRASIAECVLPSRSGSIEVKWTRGSGGNVPLPGQLARVPF
jgi:hypothetical protein